MKNWEYPRPIQTSNSIWKDSLERKLGGIEEEHLKVGIKKMKEVRLDSIKAVCVFIWVLLGLV